MSDPRLRRHAFGFLEVVDRPTPEALSEYYAQAYFQNAIQGDFPIDLFLAHEGSNYVADRSRGSQAPSGPLDA
jgi:hypothetical protein